MVHLASGIHSLASVLDPHLLTPPSTALPNASASPTVAERIDAARKHYVQRTQGTKVSVEGDLSAYPDWPFIRVGHRASDFSDSGRSTVGSSRGIVLPAEHHVGIVSLGDRSPMGKSVLLDDVLIQLDA